MVLASEDADGVDDAAPAETAPPNDDLTSPDDGWFVAFRCFTKYVQLTFFRGTSLDPVPPKGSKHPEVRYFDIHEDDELDEEQLVSWIEQAAELPGEKM